MSGNLVLHVRISSRLVMVKEPKQQIIWMIVQRVALNDFNMYLTFSSKASYSHSSMEQNATHFSVNFPTLFFLLLLGNGYYNATKTQHASQAIQTVHSSWQFKNAHLWYSTFRRNGLLQCKRFRISYPFMFFTKLMIWVYIVHILALSLLTHSL